MIDMRYKPRHLPQISAPFDVVVKGLDKEGITHEMVEMNPEELKPMQGAVLSNEVGNFDLEKMNPIWTSKDDDILDGHHRFMKALMTKQPIKCVRIGLNGRDGARVLNKIQDIYEYEEQQKMEEVITQNVINSGNERESGFDDEFSVMIENDVQPPKGNVQKIVAYRKEPIKEDSVVGNFFVLDPIDGYSKYEIEFENLLDAEEMGVDCDSDVLPIEILSKIWFPNINFEELSEKYEISVENIKNKAISKRAMRLGYDGIKYGDKLLQGLK